TGMNYPEGFTKMEIGKGAKVRDGDEIAVLSFGPMGNYVIEAANELASEDIHIGHYNMRFAKPLDTALIDEICREYEYLITIEDGTKLGGFGSAVAEYLADKPYNLPTTIMGVPDRIVEHGTQEELHREVDLDPKGIVDQVRELLGKIVT
ncbi:MAG TPA: transketolase C-terminal domain-containing protein, partial [Fodinibius sp.]|nr:transketolase C-terminal domain-containing protein [Fodinibius sp.]